FTRKGPGPRGYRRSECERSRSARCRIVQAPLDEHDSSPPRSRGRARSISPAGALARASMESRRGYGGGFGPTVALELRIRLLHPQRVGAIPRDSCRKYTLSPSECRLGRTRLAFSTPFTKPIRAIRSGYILRISYRSTPISSRVGRDARS